MKKWIGAEERVAVQFDDRRDPSAEITGCTDQPVFLTQEISLPLSAIEVSEDMCHPCIR